MEKMRVYELARDLGVDSKQVVDYLNSVGHKVKNHMSVIEGDVVARVRGETRAGRMGPAKPAAAPRPTRAGGPPFRRRAGRQGEQGGRAGGGAQRTAAASAGAVPMGGDSAAPARRL